MGIILQINCAINFCCIAVPSGDNYCIYHPIACAPELHVMQLLPEYSLIINLNSGTITPLHGSAEHLHQDLDFFDRY